MKLFNMGNSFEQNMPSKIKNEPFWDLGRPTKMGLHILCEVGHPGNPPVQIRENSEHLRNRRLELAELRPSETNSFRRDLALVCDQSMPLRRELADPQ